MNEESTAYTGWAVVELLGRRRYAGLVSEVVQFGVAMGRLDVPETGDQPAITIFFGGDSVYQLSPVSEEAARAVCQYSRPEPVRPFELTPPSKARALDAPRDPFEGRSSDIDPDLLGDAGRGDDDDGPPLDDGDDDEEWS